MSETGPGCEALPHRDAPAAPQAPALTREARHRQALENLFGAGRQRTAPFLVIEDHVIASPVAIRLFKKDFQYVSRQLQLEYRYRMWSRFDHALLDRFAATVAARLAGMQVAMQNHLERLRKLLREQGHDPDATLWPDAYRVDVPIIAQQARTYLDVLALLDRVFTLSGSASLLGVINSTQRAEIEYGCKKSVRAFRSLVETEGARLYEEARRVMAAHQERKAGAPKPPQADAHAVLPAAPPAAAALPPDVRVEAVAAPPEAAIA